MVANVHARRVVYHARLVSMAPGLCVIPRRSIDALATSAAALPLAERTSLIDQSWKSRLRGVSPTPWGEHPGAEPRGFNMCRARKYRLHIWSGPALVLLVSARRAGNVMRRRRAIVTPWTQFCKTRPLQRSTKSRGIRLSEVRILYMLGLMTRLVRAYGLP